MNAKQQKQVNVQEMLKTLGTLFREANLDSKLKQQYAEFIFKLTRADGKQPPLLSLLKQIEINIQDAKKSANTSAEGLTNKAIVNFWTKVKTVIVETYTKNKEV